MRYLEVKGTSQLNGSISVQGAKNSAVAVLAAALLSDESVYLENIPKIRDVEVIASIFDDLGVQYRCNGDKWEINPQHMHYHPITKEKAMKYRASYYFVGALLSRFKRLFIGLPGGDDFGSRPIDQHLKGFRALGAKITELKDGLQIEAEQLVGTQIYFDVITSGATMNMIMAAAKAKGETILHNAARDPEVVDLCNLLNKMGADIRGAGTDRIRIRGVKRLHGCTHSIIPDRLVAGTFIIAGIATQGDIRVEGIIPEHLKPLLHKLTEMKANFSVEEDAIHVFGEQKLRAVRVRTGMYPNFATDLQQPFTILALLAQGKSIITETIYPNRFSHVPELQRLGAVIERRKETAFIQGGSPLVGCDVRATDVRAGISLLLAALVAKGTTRIFDVEHIERGFGDIVGDFTRLGADIRYGELDEQTISNSIPQIG